jgi:hypothetical protein
MTMNLIYFAAFVSFILGASSYIIVRFWVLPIHRYRKRRRAVALALPRYRQARTQHASQAPDGTSVESLSASLRKQAAGLSDAFEMDLPHWYRMLLNSREESPVEAARLLSTLANTRKAEHIEKQIDRIKDALKL